MSFKMFSNWPNKLHSRFIILFLEQLSLWKPLKSVIVHLKTALMPRFLYQASMRTSMTTFCPKLSSRWTKLDQTLLSIHIEWLKCFFIAMMPLQVITYCQIIKDNFESSRIIKTDNLLKGSQVFSIFGLGTPETGKLMSRETNQRQNTVQTRFNLATKTQPTQESNQSCVGN